MDADRKEWESELLHERVSLDFVSTVSDRTAEAPIERLDDFAAVLRLGRLMGLLSSATVEAMRSSTSKAEAGRIHKDALLLRDALYGLFRASVEGRAPEERHLETFNRVLAEASSHRRLVPLLSGRFHEELQPADHPRYVLWAVALDAAELLMGSERERLRLCPACLWLFVDRSRNQSRRWCDMSTCGNRIKARRFQQKRRPGRRGRSDD